ncbi:hypothetical protein Pmar_PMAR022353 [Perkinsus marinus ATCC 50983]|uniref:Uncharacterized protein n=1 Tax=Perkinsus marinus (strain ATCC 50983 / TXsc) TaxID=423536 RepID=C5KDV0_PERM5|nr:hypothetical protein Pmar_PMAR022353 [Perkinsus marinus ATCC 50983]EER17403.1 hypothetical protein Pmar_PMAR022353 [Perkinsus marinus ATCC 50983]|eukprot:XP_002785607.1 hypothetical protein Pmar_PMAR022353 [Perkinsus marinus ATCC 50983]
MEFTVLSKIGSFERTWKIIFIIYVIASASEAVDRFGIPFAEHHLKGQGNVGHLGFQTGVPPIVVQRSNRARPPLHPTTSRKSSTGVSANNQKRTVVTLTDPLHDLRQIPGGDEQTRKVYVAKADEERDNRVEEEKKAVDSLDPPLKAWPITSFLVFRIPGAAIYLIICAALAATIYTWSLAWIKSEDTFPLFQCPSSSVVEHDVNVDGTYCQLTFSFDNITNYRAAAVGFQKDNGVGSTCWIPSRYQYEDCGPGHLCYVRCNAPVSCTLALNGPSGQPSPKPFGGNSSCAKTVKWGADENYYIDRGCTQTIYLQQDQATTVPQTAIAVQPYCDLGSTVSPADIIGIRGIFLGALVFLLIYIVAVLTIRTAYKRVMETHAAELSILEPHMNDVREDMHSVVERRWCGLPVSAGQPHDSLDHNGPKFETGSLLELNTAAKPGKPPMTSADHKRRFASGSWRYRLRLMAGLRARKKAMVASRVRNNTAIMGISYLLLIVCIMCLVLLDQPLNYVQFSPRAFLDPIVYPDTRNSRQGLYVWLDVLAFSDYVIEFIVLSLGIASSLFKKGKEKQSTAKSPRESSHELNTASTGVTLSTRDVELGIEPCPINEEEGVEARSDPVFPDSVCAIVLIHTVVSPDINYSYLPENNRILGAYWANKIWIPYAGKKTTMGSGGGGELKSGNSGVFEPKSNGGINSTFRYALMIDDIETVLPSTFDLHSLNLEETRPAAVHFPVTIDPRNRPSQDLAKFADMQLLYQLTLIRFQSQFFGAVLSTQRGVSLWHRGTLDKVLYEHGTEPFSVSNLYAGLLMLRQRDEDTIELAEELAPQTFGKSPYVDVGFRPRNLLECVAQETESAAPARFMMLYLRELLWVPSLTHFRSVIMKPYLFFIPILSGILDFLRPLHFVLLFGSNWQERALTGDENSLRVGLRVDDIRDIPPCPPSTEVDWFSVWKGAGPHGNSGDHHHAERQLSEEMEPGSSDGRRGGLTDGEISTPHHIGAHRTRVVHTPTGHSPVVDPRVPPPVVQRSPRSRPPLHPSTPRRSRPGMLGSSPRSWAQSGGEARSQLPSSTASSSERGQQMVDEEKGKEAVEVVEDAAAGGVVEANTGGENGASDESFYDGEYLGAGPIEQGGNQPPRFRADTFKSDGGESDFNSDAEGSIAGDGEIGGRGRLVGKGGVPVSTDRSFGAILKQERQYLRARTPPPFLSPLPEIVRVLGAIIALVLAVGVAVTIMVGSFGWVTALNCPFPAVPFAATENIDGLYCRVRVSYASSIQLQQDWSRIYAPFTASVEDSSGSLGCRQEGSNEVNCLSTLPCDFTVQLSGGSSCPSDAILWTQGGTNDVILPFDGSCRYLLALDLQQSFVSGAGISVEPFCTTDGEVPPGKVIIANALLILCAGWIIFVVIGEIRFYVNRQKRARMEKIDRAVMERKLPGIHAAYRRRVQASWTEQANREHRRLLEKQAEEQHSDTDSVKSPQSVFSVDVDSPSGLRSNVHMAFEHGNLQDLAGGLVKTVDEEGNPIHPYARFQSKEWRARVSVALLEIQYRAKTALRRGVFYWALTLILSWLLLFLCCLLVVAVFPDQVYQNSGKLDLWDYIRNGADGESVPVVAVIDWLVLLDGLILTILAFLPALLSSCWPPLPVSRKGRDGRSVSESVNAGAGAVAGGVPMGVLGEGNEQSGELVTDVCVIVAMRSGCCTDPVKRGRVRKILRRCTTLLPPKVHGCSPIFVVEVGEGLSPADDCCKMIQDFVSPDVNYAYLPEDNKAMAIYWANKSWIPSVLRWANPQENRNSAFRYALLITDADSDDDMMLPVALDLNTQKYRREGTKVVWYMPTVRGVSNMPSVTLRDYIVKQRAIMSFTQEKLGGSCVVTPLKAVSLWDRAALHKTLAGFVGVNDTHSPGLLQPSLMMEQYLRHDFETCMGGSQIRTDTGSSNFASECGRWYFRLRMFVVAFVPTIRLKGCCSREALVGRIWSFIADVVPTIVIILRPFLLVSIFVRQPALIGVYFGIYFVIFHGISVALMAITLRNRRDVRRQWNWFTASIIFPFYKIYQYVVDIYPALLHVMFSVNRVPGGRQSTRTGASMPLPPAKDVDWFTVWRASSHSASSLPNADPEPSSAQRRKYKNRRKNDQ